MSESVDTNEHVTTSSFPEDPTNHPDQEDEKDEDNVDEDNVDEVEKNEEDDDEEDDEEADEEDDEEADEEDDEEEDKNRDEEKDKNEEGFEELITKQPFVYVLSVDHEIICASFDRAVVQRELERHIRHVTVSFQTHGPIFVEHLTTDHVVMTLRPHNHLFSSERVIARLTVSTIDFI